VGRATTDVPEGTDDLIRLRDGYSLVMEVAPRPFMKCPTCHLHLSVPELKVAEVKCLYCYPRKENGHPIFFVGYFPLSDKLLTHLERTSPKRHTAWAAEMRRKNEARKAELKRELDNEYESGLLDVHDFALGKVGVSKLGYTKKGSPHSFGGVF